MKAEVRLQSAKRALCRVPTAASGLLRVTCQYRFDDQNTVGANPAQIWPPEDR
jgi:hypothetical protein